MHPHAIRVSSKAMGEWDENYEKVDFVRGNCGSCGIA